MNKLWGLIKKHKIITSILFTVVMITAILGVQITPTKTPNKSSVSIGQIGQKYEITIGSGVDASTTADYTATGTAAQQTNTFQIALNALPATGGILTILSGTYTLNATLSRAIPNVTIDGIGNSTIFSDNGSTPIFAAGTGWNFQNLVLDAGGISGTFTGSNITIGTNYYAIYGTGVNAPTGRTANYVIAASNSHPDDKAQANVTLGVSTDLGASVNAAVTAGYYNIRICGGTFAKSTAFNFSSLPVNLHGDGRYITVVNEAASGTTFNFIAGGLTDVPSTISDITFVGTTSCVAIHDEHVSMVYFSNVVFLNYPTIATIIDMEHWKFDKCWFRNSGNNTTSMFIFSAGGGTFSSDIWFNACEWEANGGDVFEVTTTVSGLYFIAPKVEWASGNYSFIKTTGGGSLTALNVSGGGMYNDANTCNVPLINVVGGANRVIGTIFQGLLVGTSDVIFSSGNNNFVSDGSIGAPPQTYTNLIANGSFEAATITDQWTSSGPTLAKSNTHAVYGTNAAKLTRVGSDGQAYQVIASPTAYTNAPVTFSCWVWCASANTGRIGIATDGGGGGFRLIYSAFHSGGSGWARLTVTCYVGSAPTYLQVYLIISNNNTDVWYDGAMLVNGYNAVDFSPMPANAATE